MIVLYENNYNFFLIYKSLIKSISQSINSYDDPGTDWNGTHWGDGLGLYID